MALPAHAQPLFARADSLEATIANADLVLVGTVEKYKRNTGEDRAPFDAVIVVEEHIKKPVFDDGYTKVSIDVPSSEDDLIRWQKEQTRLLLALDSDALPKDKTTVIELEKDRLKTLSADLKLLRDPEKALRIARETVRRTPAGVKRVHTFGFRVPREEVKGLKWEEYYKTSGHLELRVPVDDRLEKRAIEWLRTKDYSRRHEAARALRYFKSDENIQRMKDLLDDPGWGYLRHAQENNGVELRHYGVRNQAYEALKTWGINVDKPKIREEVRK